MRQGSNSSQAELSFRVCIASGDITLSDNTFHSDPVMRLAAQRAARTTAEDNQQTDVPKESKSVTMIIYAWAAVGLVAFGVATTSLVTQSDDQSPAQIAFVPDLAIEADESPAKVSIS